MRKRILAMLTLGFMVGCTAKHNILTIEGEIDTINSNLKEICVKGPVFQYRRISMNSKSMTA